MIAQRPIYNSAFDEFVTLLVQLHGLIREGKGDEVEADAVRDLMDGPWARLTRDELALADGLSVDLYTIGEPWTQSGDESAAIGKVAEAMKNGQWPRALAVLRERQNEMRPPVAAAFRAVCWGSMGRPDVAVEFAGEAASLLPNETTCAMLHMTLLLLTDRLDDAEILGERFVVSADDPGRLFAAANAFFLKADHLEADESTRLHKRAIETAEKALRLAESLNGDELLQSQRRNARLNMALSYDFLGQREKAIQSCHEILRLDPTDSEALTLLGWLNYPQFPPEGRAEFRVDVRQSILEQLPLRAGVLQEA